MTRQLVIFCLFALLGTGCEIAKAFAEVFTTLSTEEQKTYIHPDITHKESSEHYGLSGSKLLEPEQLNNVILNLLSNHTSNSLDPNPIDPTFRTMGGKHNRYPVYLGGMDYQPITKRTKEVTPLMPIIMDELAYEVCQLFVNQQVPAGTDAREQADNLHRRLCSRPIDDDTYDRAKEIWESTGVTNPQTADWKDVCVYFLLKEGSFFMN